MADPDHQIREGGGGVVSKKFSSALPASVWSKNKGRPRPLDTPLSRNPNCFQMFFKM